MIKKKRRENEFDNYMNIETPKFESKCEDEQWNPNPLELSVMFILMCVGMYFLLTGFLYGIPEF